MQTHDVALSELGLQPLNARSLMLSALLGSHPPSLPTSALVALAELFGIRPGTARTSLSRMVASGDLEIVDGRYVLAGRLLDRQREQDAGQIVGSADWDGSWITAISVDGRRSMAARRSFRHAMQVARMAELRPDIWLRPGNHDAPPRSAGVLITRGTVAYDDIGELTSRLWDLDAAEAQASRLLTAIDEHERADGGDNFALLPTGFVVSAAVIRFLRTEPQLPEELTPSQWSIPTLREAFGRFDMGFRDQLRAFFASLR